MKNSSPFEHNPDLSNAADLPISQKQAFHLAARFFRMANLICQKNDLSDEDRRAFLPAILQSMSTLYLSNRVDDVANQIQSGTNSVSNALSTELIALGRKVEDAFEQMEITLERGLTGIAS